MWEKTQKTNVYDWVNSMVIKKATRQQRTAFMIKTLADIRRAGGEIIEDQDWICERMEKCKACPFYGKVKPLRLFVTDGCTLCGCPGEEKVRTLTKLNTSLEYVKESCPHPEVDQWADIDSKYLKLIENGL